MIEREWREASDMRRSTASLAAILAIAAALRFNGLAAGIPFAIGVDEPHIMDRAVGMMRSGDCNPHFYDYPTLYIYLQLAVAAIRFMAGAAAGEWHALNDVTSADFLLWGRGLTAALGTLTVLLVHQAGLRWGTRPALLAAGLMAVMPLHVRESHYVLTDVPATFVVALTLLMALRAHERPAAAAFAWAGVTAGLAAATKYPAGSALLLPLLVAWMTPGARPSRRAAALAAAGGAAAAFLLAAPYTILDLPNFLNGYARLMASYAPESGESVALIYVKHLRNSVQWPALLLMGGGAALAVVRAIRGPGRVRWLLAVAYPALYFWILSGQSLVYGRYLLPLVPFVCLLAAAAVVSGVSLLRRFSIPRALRSALIVGLTVAALLPSAITSIRFNRELGRKGTAALAFEWILRNVPANATVVIESAGLVLTHTPQYQSRNIRQLRQHDYAHYVRTGADYLVASSQVYGPYFEEPHRHPREYAEYMRIFEQSEEVARFTATPQHPGPELRIFRVQRSGPERAVGR